MRKIIALIVSLFMISQAHAAANWIKLSSNQAATYYGDPDTVSYLPGRQFEIWMKLEFKKPMSVAGKTATYALTRQRVDCKDFTSGDISTSFYDSRDQLIQNHRPPITKLTPFEPDSMAGSLAKYLCKAG